MLLQPNFKAFKPLFSCRHPLLINWSLMLAIMHQKNLNAFSAFQGFPEWLRQESTSGDHLVHPPVQAGSARAGYSGLCPAGGFQVSPKVEIPQDLLATHSCVWVNSSPHMIPNELSHKKILDFQLKWLFVTEYDKEIIVLSAACHTEHFCPLL